MEAYDTLCCSNYIRLSENPEVISAVRKIADLISSMTIHLMENTEHGDVRIKNELSKRIDISPSPYMTRKTFLAALVRILLLEGDGNCFVFPETKEGYLNQLYLLPPNMTNCVPNGFGYQIFVSGKSFEPDQLLHFIINPSPEYPWKGEGYRISLRDIVKNLKQATATKKGFMESKWKPSLVVRVDGMAEEFSSKEGRKKLREQYLETSEAGEPWMIPADLIDVKEVKPLSLSDLAINEAVTLDKKTVAAILDVPAFLVGAGEFHKEEWNNFINTRIKPLCNAIEQEFTRKLLLHPNWYFRFNMRSLYSYNLTELAQVGAEQYVRGIMTGNEVRDWLGMTPLEGLDDLVILENYIPRGMIGEQKKLIQEQGGEG